MKRNNGRLKSVPGCKSEGESGTDYCYDPRDVPPPTPKPSRKPTMRPTKPPTLPDTIFIGPTSRPSAKKPSPVPFNNGPDSIISPSYPITTTGDSFDENSLALEPTPMPSTGSILDDNEVWINFPSVVLDLTVPRDGDGSRSRRELPLQTGETHHHRFLVDKTEIQRIVGTLLDDTFREKWESFRGLLIGARERESVELTRARVVSYELSGSALFLRGENSQVPGMNAVRAAMVEALDTAPLLFELRLADNVELQGAQALSLTWADGSEFVRPVSLQDEDGSNNGGGRSKGVGVAAGLAAFIGVVALGGVLGVYCLRRGRGIFNHNASSFRRSATGRDEEEEGGETPRIGAKRREVVASHPPIVKSATVPLGTYSDEEAAPNNFDRGSELDGSGSWTMERVGVPEPVVAVPVEETAAGASTVLGNVHAASVLQLDAGDGASQDDFSGVWGHGEDASYHGSSITSGTFSQRSVSLRGFSQAPAQLSEIVEGRSSEQANVIGLAPGETLALSECLPKMKNRKNGEPDGSVAGNTDK